MCSENIGADTAKLTCAFVFAQAFCWFSYAVAHYCKATYIHGKKMWKIILQNVYIGILYRVCFREENNEYENGDTLPGSHDYMYF